jgi:hypothetical protein
VDQDDVLCFLFLDVLDNGVDDLVNWHNVVNLVVLLVVLSLINTNKHLYNLLVASVFICTLQERLM